MNNTGKLTDAELISELMKADKNETLLVTEILIFLAEFDRRKLYLPKGYNSLFAYCVGRLKYSESAASIFFVCCVVPIICFRLKMSLGSSLFKRESKERVKHYFKVLCLGQVKWILKN